MTQKNNLLTVESLAELASVFLTMTKETIERRQAHTSPYSILKG